METNIAERIKSAKLTKSQKKIAEYFVKNQDRIGGMSSLDVAREIGVSDASIIRFSRAIGFEGYADLKEHIYNSLVASAHGSLSLSQRFLQNKEKYNCDVTPDLFRTIVQQNLDSVFHNNRMEDVEEVADAILRANRRYVVGMRGCRGLATKFGRLLSFILPGVQTITDTECTSLFSVQDISEGDVLLMFVFSRFYKSDLDYVRIAKSQGAKVCLVSNDLTGPLNPFADIILIVSTSNMSFYHSTLGADMLGEFILNLISSQVDFKDRMDERDFITSNLRL